MASCFSLRAKNISPATACTLLGRRDAAAPSVNRRGRVPPQPQRGQTRGRQLCTLSTATNHFGYSVFDASVDTAAETSRLFDVKFIFNDMWLVLCVWVAVAILASGSSAVVAKPCRPAYWNTRNGVVHTACQPRNRNCTILLRGLSNREKKDFLRRHNKLRSLIAMGRLKGFKPAANMYELVWDDELAEVAQALADQCGDMMHDNANGRFTPTDSS
ncbi:hypothetical protein HPB52_005293 [Rhipicephalus sanguineus]|uniref:SCP domain-containing protein n=1 Tax=Rhipicephalus sanguineus TaxID=34632 RepID=A0A9D4T8L2_RHISA|nr:hypothetical protein HPB52_005293 [Rhipicephalus sanguineus]